MKSNRLLFFYKVAFRLMRMGRKLSITHFIYRISIQVCFGQPYNPNHTYLFRYNPKTDKYDIPEVKANEAKFVRIANSPRLE